MKNQFACLKDDSVKIVHLSDQGISTILKQNIILKKDEIIDATFMSKRKLKDFLRKEINDAKESDILLSLHMKATMMKVSDPIIFGHVVKIFYKSLIIKHEDIFENLSVDFNNGFGDLIDKDKNSSRIKTKRNLTRYRECL